VLEIHLPTEKKIRGVIRAWESHELSRKSGRRFVRGRFLWEAENLFVNSGKPPLANLLAGNLSGEDVLAFGFGSGTGTPAVTDTALWANPAYYNAPTGHTFPASNQVQFNWQIATTDYGLIGMSIQEMGMFANTGAAVLPAAVGTTNPAWAANLAEVVGNLIVDSNGNIQRASGVTSDAKTGGSAPAWATAIGATTTDNHVTWTLVALHTAPTPLMAHRQIALLAIDGTASFTGTWTLSF
jgi:hypothetical protein